MNRAWSAACFTDANTRTEREWRDLALAHAAVAVDHARQATNCHCTVIVNDCRLSQLSALGRDKFGDILVHEVYLALGDRCVYCAADCYVSDPGFIRVRITLMRG